MDFLTPLIAALNSITPLGEIALLTFIIWKQTKGSQQVATITDNHLHSMPEMLETLQRIEVSLTAIDVYLHARLNGGPKP